MCNSHINFHFVICRNQSYVMKCSLSRNIAWIFLWIFHLSVFLFDSICLFFLFNLTLTLSLLSYLLLYIFLFSLFSYSILPCSHLPIPILILLFIVRNPCLSSPCLNRGQCISLVSSYICTCSIGLTGDMCEKSE